MKTQQYQSGVVLLVTLIALVIIMITSIALIRSTESSSLIAGSIAFKRDMINQAERAMPAVRARFLTGALNGLAARQADLILANYSATMLATNANGIPNVLMNTTNFNATYGVINNFNDANAVITVRYVVDRMCFAVGNLSLTNCMLGDSSTDIGGSTKGILGVGGSGSKAEGTDSAVYRISMRVSGPRNAETFLQSTFTI